MSSHSLITSQLLASLKNLKPEQLICGEEHHPRKLPHTVAVPDTMKKYLNRSAFIEMCFCQKGDCAVTINGRSFAMQQDDLCIIGRNAINYEAPRSLRRSYTLTWFFFGQFSFMSMHQSIYGRDGSFNVVNRQRVTSSRELHQKAELVAQWGSMQKLEKWDSLKKELYGLFAFYGRQMVSVKSTTTNAWHRMILQKAEKYLRHNLAKRVTLAGLAKKYSFSPSYLNMLFKREYNYGLIEYLIFLRLGKAASLLVASRWRINEISRRCGYEDQYYFSRLFKKTFGMSPRQYRQNFA
jgi:AraC-like DNA-binding protein